MSEQMPISSFSSRTFAPFSSRMTMHKNNVKLEHHPVEENPLRKRLNLLLLNIHEQNRVLNELQLDEIHSNITVKLKEWKLNMFENVNKHYDKCEKDNCTSYKHLSLFQQTISNILTNHILKRLQQSTISKQDLNELEVKLQQMKIEIDILKQANVKLDSKQCQIVGQLRLLKVNQQLSCDEIYKNDENQQQQLVASVSATEEQQELPSLRLLVSKYHVDKINSFDQSYVHLTTLSTIPECILTIKHDDTTTNKKKLITLFSGMINIFKIDDNDDEQQQQQQQRQSHYEIRYLIDEQYASSIIGKLGENAKLLKEKYSLDTLKVYPTSCPHSNERVVLLKAMEKENIILCLADIYLNIIKPSISDQQFHFYDLINYDYTMTDCYGGYREQSFTNNSNKKKTQSNSELSSFSNMLEYTFTNNEHHHKYEDKDNAGDSDGEDVGYKQHFSIRCENEDIIVQELSGIDWKNSGRIIGPFGMHIDTIRQKSGASIHLAEHKNDKSLVKGTKKQIDIALKLIEQLIHENHGKILPFQKHRSHGKRK
ncbi:unnamed protein product [Didymodactylos carnosus]|uniref:K Homology domain-containing protein n=1 Tax=Didymodactylos carnosus TaxID=1234261 RepID=A0A813PBP3_9BILA|nr:unnamed protein product [Didymodactylos carnosus]CAF3527145.1 unnamed protein product [Didymodactylos carnosus]